MAMFPIQNPANESWQEDAETVIYGDDLLESVDPREVDDYETLSLDDLLQEDVEPSGVMRVAPRFSRPSYEGPLGKTESGVTRFTRPAASSPPRHKSSNPPLPLPRLRASMSNPPGRQVEPFFEQPTPEMHTRATWQTFRPESRPPASAAAYAREASSIPPPPPLPRGLQSRAPAQAYRAPAAEVAHSASVSREGRPDTLRPYVRSTGSTHSSRPPAARRAASTAPSAEDFLALRVSWSGLLAAAGQLTRLTMTGAFVAMLGMVLGVSSATLLAGESAPQEPSQVASVQPFELDADAIEPVAQPTFLERVRSGRKDAVAQLAERDPTSLSPEEVDALSEGRETLARRKTTDVVSAMIEKEGRLTENDKAVFLRHAGDARTYRQALRLMAQRDTWQGPDLIHAALASNRQNEDIADFARAMLLTPRVYKYASPALTVVIDAETSTECDVVQQLVERAYEDADNRAVPHMAKYAKTTGCGEEGREDCYPCLRGDRALVDALRAAQGRRPPY